MMSILEKQVLIVDDNLKNLQIVARLLKNEGYNIALAQDGKSAVNQAKANPPHLILLDIMMPEMDGFEVCKTLKLHDELKGIPIIFLTAKNQTADIIEGFNLGGVDYITKPFNQAELLSRVKTHLDLFISKREIVEMNENRDLIYAIIAHDIKSPFNKITQLLTLLKEGLISPDSHDFNELLAILDEQNGKTLDLINCLLEWSETIKTKVLQIQQNNIYELIEYSRLFLKEPASNKSIEVINNVPEDTTATFEWKSLATVMRNLIGNSIKFTPENGTITINACENGNSIGISVSDTGIGIEKNKIDILLKKNAYFTTYGTNNEKGSGLGLPIVKDFVRRNKGELLIESDPPRGTTITVVLNKIL
jgi:two-component system, sensor histidine kinase and response regulator